MVEGKKATLKNPLGRMFCEYLMGRPCLRETREIDSLARLFRFQHVLLTWLFCGLASHELFAKFTCSSTHSRLFTNLILNPIQ